MLILLFRGINLILMPQHMTYWILFKTQFTIKIQ